MVLVQNKLIYCHFTFHFSYCSTPYPTRLYHELDSQNLEVHEDQIYTFFEDGRLQSFEVSPFVATSNYLLQDSFLFSSETPESHSVRRGNDVLAYFHQKDRQKEADDFILNDSKIHTFGAGIKYYHKAYAFLAHFLLIMKKLKQRKRKYMIHVRKYLRKLVLQWFVNNDHVFR